MIESWVYVKDYYVRSEIMLFTVHILFTAAQIYYQCLLFVESYEFRQLYSQFRRLYLLVSPCEG